MAGLDALFHWCHLSSCSDLSSQLHLWNRLRLTSEFESITRCIAASAIDFGLPKDGKLRACGTLAFGLCFGFSYLPVQLDISA